MSRVMSVPFQRPKRRLSSFVSLTTLCLAGCFSLPEIPEQAAAAGSSGTGGSGSIDVVGGSSGASGTSSTPVDPHGLSATDPGHGPFVGGTRVVLQGQGFRTDQQPRVWFDDIEVATSDVIALSSGKIQVITPAHAPGDVDVKVQNANDTSTARTLISGFTYDSFFATPSQGPTTGGTRITVTGSSTNWGADTKVKIGNSPCTDVNVESKTKLKCTTSAAAAGSRSVAITANGETSVVLDAFLYSDSDNGYRGGLGGDPLNGQLKVIALSNTTGEAIKGAAVILGDEITNDSMKITESNGMTIFEDNSLNAPITVTIAAKCMQPITYVDVPTDTVTAYLDPVSTPDCVSDEIGDPPPTGGKPVAATGLEGELRFGSKNEFGRGPWNIVPPPANENERRVAYIFSAVPDPRSKFVVPYGEPITEESPGDLGYNFTLSLSGGNLTLYALAGIENSETYPKRFTAYAMGVTRGVSAPPGGEVTNVAIAVDLPLDQAITVGALPPQATASGPNRIQMSVAILFGVEGYAILPNAQIEHLLPFAGTAQVVGLPPLQGSLSEASYVTSAQVGTGVTMIAPLAIAAKYTTKTTSTPIIVDTFVQIPQGALPGEGATWDGQSFDVSSTTTGVPPELYTVELKNNGGVATWRVIAPGSKPVFKVPDLRKIGLGLPAGATAVDVNAAVFEQGFDYGQLLSRQTRSGAWLAYSKNSFYVQLPPL